MRGSLLRLLAPPCISGQAMVFNPQPIPAPFWGHSACRSDLSCQSRPTRRPRRYWLARHRLEQTPLATAISESVWLFPIIEGSHILALPLSVGMILMFDLRLLGLAFQGGSASRLMRDVVRWSKFGFAVMFITGVLLFMTHASQAYENVFFRTKLVLLLMCWARRLLFEDGAMLVGECLSARGSAVGCRSSSGSA